MEKDTIKDLFQNLEGEFDVNEPRWGHENRFLQKLNNKHELDETRPHGIFVTLWKPLLTVAAVLLVGLFLVIKIQQQEPELMDLASVSPELSQTQDFFTVAINKELTLLEAERSPETENLINKALKELSVLETRYEQLKIDLTESDNDQRVIHAMINNFQSRINVLQTVLTHIEEVKTFKLNQNENTTTI